MEFELQEHMDAESSHSDGHNRSERFLKISAQNPKTSDREYFLRVLPVHGDEWVAFDKYGSFIEARLAREILKGSRRFKGVEMLPRTIIQANEGVDAVILAEMQIAGSWTYAEQQMVHRQADKRRMNLIGGSNGSIQRDIEKMRVRRLKWINAGFDELVQIFGDAMDADPDLIGDRRDRLAGLPRRSIERIKGGERTAYGAFVMSMNDKYISIRVPKNADGYYGKLAERVSKDTGLSMASLFCAMLELWDAAPVARRQHALRTVSGRGVVMRSRAPMKERTVDVDG